MQSQCWLERALWVKCTRQGVHGLKYLRYVADAAALCTIDLKSNCTNAHKQYMNGEIARDTFDDILSRRKRLEDALRKAGAQNEI